MEEDLQRTAEEHFEEGNRLDENGERGRAIREWQQAIRLDPDHAAAHFNLALAYHEIGHTDLAVEQMHQAIRVEPFDNEARRELAEIYVDVDKVREAIDTLRQALNVVPEDELSAHRLAELYLDQEMWDEAASALEAGGMIEEDANLFFELGKAYADQERTKDAILAFRRALACQPDHRDAEEALRRMHVPVEEPPDPNEIT